MTTTVVPCKRPKVDVIPHESGVAGAYQAVCRVPGCEFTFNSVKTACEEAAIRHRAGHRETVPETEILRFESGVYQASCSCGWYRESPGVHTRADNQAALDFHLTYEHGLVVCS